MKLTHTLFALLAAALLPGWLPVFGAKERPNILLIVSDDHGYADVGFQGCKDIPTPHLDGLARGGVHCTSGYVSHPFCSPTRAGLMTGRYQQRFGHQNNPFYDPADHKEGLPVGERLLPEFLGQAGYVTGWVGKWHLGAAPEFHPEKRGFAETFGFIGGGHKYLDWTVNPAAEYTVPIERNGKPVAVTEHLTVAFGQEASAFVKRHAGTPWFLYLAFNAPHTPHEPTVERLARFASIENPVRRKYAAQVSLLDDAIGGVLDTLSATGQETNTLVFFFSDNGGPTNVNGSCNAPLRGAKGDVYEGGVRVPFVVRWPAKLPAGKSCELPVSSLDVFATALGAAGADMPKGRTYDSVNLLPFLRGEQVGAPHDQLFWRTSKNRWAVRQGSMKLVRQQGRPDELYIVQPDIGEKNDLLPHRAGDPSQLVSVLEAWDKELIEPVFPGAGARNPGKKPKQKR